MAHEDAANGAVGMAIGYKAIAFLENLTAADIAMLPPARRERLAQMCERTGKLVAALKAPPAPALETGVLVDLRAGAPRG